MTSNELKPCPFCGKQPSFGLGKKTGCQLHGDPIQYVDLACRNTNCHVRPRVSGGDRYSSGYEDGPLFKKCEQEARQIAVEKWHTRADKHDTAGNDKALDKKGWEKKNIEDAIQRARNYEKFRPQALKSVQKATPIGDDSPGFIIQVDTISELICLEYALQQDGVSTRSVETTALLKEARQALDLCVTRLKAASVAKTVYQPHLYCAATLSESNAEAVRDKLSAAIEPKENK
jgi:hypothetical protein